MLHANQKDRLLSMATMQVLRAVVAVLVPTAVMMALIAVKTVRQDGTAILVDIPLGTILVFSSVAAIAIPWIYRISLSERG
jgi:putative effector of murein hydrolase LrgA (UPF0299 family)